MNLLQAEEKTYNEAILVAIRILANDPEGEDWDTIRAATDAAEGASKNIQAFKDTLAMLEDLDL